MEYIAVGKFTIYIAIFLFRGIYKNLYCRFLFSDVYPKTYKQIIRRVDFVNYWSTAFLYTKLLRKWICMTNTSLLCFQWERNKEPRSFHSWRWQICKLQTCILLDLFYELVYNVYILFSQWANHFGKLFLKTSGLLVYWSNPAWKYIFWRSLISWILIFGRRDFRIKKGSREFVTLFFSRESIRTLKKFEINFQ